MVVKIIIGVNFKNVNHYWFENIIKILIVRRRNRLRDIINTVRFYCDMCQNAILCCISNYTYYINYTTYIF